jgi:Zn-finger nucleic acid-binding protein
MSAVVACPKCGAPSATAQKPPWTCSFCGAVVAEEAAKVIERIIERVVVVEKGSKPSLPCPRCNVGLFEGAAGGVSLWGCGSCGGVWLDNAGSFVVRSRIEQQLFELTDRAARAKKTSPDTTALAKCPVDRKDLERVEVKGIQIDVCAEHGTWFDAGEARALASAFNRERLESESLHAGGISYDYSADAKQALDTQAMLDRFFDRLIRS